MAREERTRALLGDAGFTDVRTDEVNVRFAFEDLDEYERWVTDLSGSFAMVLKGLPEPSARRSGRSFAPRSRRTPRSKATSSAASP